MNTNKSIEMNHISNSKSSGLSHMATLPKNMTFCNNVATSNMNESVVSNLNFLYFYCNQDFIFK